MFKRVRSTLVALLALVLLTGVALPATLFAAEGGGLVVCAGTKEDPCTYEKLIDQVQTIINFLIFKIASPLAAIMFAYAGFLYVTNGGNEGKIKEAHEIFWNVFIGLVVALAAWLVVNFILTFLIKPEFNFLG